MSIYLNRDNKVIVQGITGGEGTKHTARMLAAGTQVVGGVNARKAGTTVSHKDSDGNPQIKGKIRQKQRELARSRMMSSVPKADVVITNPTHLAVALEYNREIMEAPVLVAKGSDFLARKIRELAEEHGVPVVENKPLARAIYESMEIGEEIPEHLYKAMAEVLAFIYKLKGAKNRGASPPRTSVSSTEGPPQAPIFM